MIRQRTRFLGSPVAAAAIALASAAAAEPALTSAVYSGGKGPPPVTLAAYRALTASQSRNYDRAQDISLRQMLILLEVSERAEASLGQALATGELESARTWNDYVRPTLKNGSLGSATGVWQFLPGTFHNIVKKFGTRLLAASEADPATGRDRLDLGDGPFTDAKVRSVIAETVGGSRGADDEELQLLRHNFAVLAFAKHYLSVDSGATTPEEDYLFHFLGAGQGRRVLALARGEARYTLCVKPVEVPVPPADTKPESPAGEAPITTIAAIMKAEAAAQAVPTVASPPAVVARAAPAPSAAPAAPRPAPPAPSTIIVIPAKSGTVHVPASAAVPPANPGSGGRDARAPRVPPARITKTGAPAAAPDLKPDPSAPDRLLARMQAEAALQAAPAGVVQPAIASVVVPPAPPPVSSEWGLPANSATVTGNLGMFYRDGKGQSQPYTWAGFMDNLARRVRAKDQPALVRAKYGVGFPLKGGDVPERAFNPQAVGEAAAFYHENSGAVVVPEALVTGSLSRDETRWYKQRLAALLSQGEDKPLDTLPPEAVAALHHLRILPPNVQEASTTNPQLQKALHGFRKKVGKDEPDDPAHTNLLMPAERIALEVYDQRLTRYAAMQAGQQAFFGRSPDLNRIRKMSPRAQRSAAPHIAAVQAALAAQGLLTPPTQKSVWRDKKKKKHIEYKTAPFAGKPDKETVAALNTFQLRRGLRKTDGVLDAVTLYLLRLPPLGPEIFQPPSGPQCAFEWWGGTAPMCEVLAKRKPSALDNL